MVLKHGLEIVVQWSCHGCHSSEVFSVDTVDVFTTSCISAELCRDTGDAKADDVSCSM